MTKTIKIELRDLRSKIEFHKKRNESQPNAFDLQWVEILSFRIEKLERALLIEQAKKART